jgi:hypothetical protein
LSGGRMSERDDDDTARATNNEGGELSSLF